MDQRPGHRHRALQRVDRGVAAELIPDRREQTIGAELRRRARVEQQERAGPVGVLGVPGRKARLTEQGRLLIPEDPRDGSAAEHPPPHHATQHTGGGDDLREHRPGNADLATDLLVPVERPQIHEQSPGGVGGIGDVQGGLAVVVPPPAPGEVPHQPRVDGPREQFTRLGALGPTLALGVQVIQDPPDLGAREVGRQGQSRGGAETIVTLRVPLRQARADPGRARVLPHDRVVHGQSGGPIPHHRRLTLIGDPDRAHRRRLQVHMAGDLRHRRAHIRPDLHRIVLHPPGVREDLPVFDLGGGGRDGQAVVVEEYRPRRRGALIYRQNVGVATHIPETTSARA